MSYRRHFTAAIGKLEAERRYRVFADLERSAENFPTALWHRADREPDEVTIWCSNDYLGMGRHPEVISAMTETAAKHGVGAGGTRNIAGTSHPLVKLEARTGRSPRQGRARWSSPPAGFQTWLRSQPSPISFPIV